MHQPKPRFLAAVAARRRRKPDYQIEDLGYETPCWRWLKALDKDGYGTCSVDNRYVRAHRLSYEWDRGPIAEGLVLDHLCRVSACVNPDHLEPVTVRENTLRGRTPKLTTEQVAAIRAATHLQGKEIARIYGMSEAQISRIRNEHQWKLV